LALQSALIRPSTPTPTVQPAFVVVKDDAAATAAPTPL